LLLPGRRQTGAAGIDRSQRRLEELLTNAMLFVLPWEIEGRSLALLEALAAGLCVLTSDIPENREFVDGVGFTFRKNDAKDLERMLRLRIADGEVRRSAGRNAKQRIQDGYLWPNIAQQVEQVYLEMMGWKQGPRSGSTETAHHCPGPRKRGLRNKEKRTHIQSVV